MMQRMPIYADRDLEATRRALEEWVAERMIGAEGVTIPAVVAPEGTGFSNETHVFDVRYRHGDEERVWPLVARLQKPDQTIFPDLDVTRQAAVMSRVASHSEVPVPDVLWVEHDAGVLGTPFYVMEKIEGSIPTDVPSYHETGFVTEMSPSERRRMWDSGLDAMARIHRIDWKQAGLEFLDRPDDGGLGLPQLLAYLQRYFDWTMQGAPYPTAERAWEWLAAHLPTDPTPVGLCWGDARPSNMIFRGGECVAVLDWEMSVLGPPEQDLGWWLHFDRFSSEGYGVPRLAGLPSHDETVAIYTDLTGHEPRDLVFYEVLAGFFFVLIMVRVAQALHGIGLLEADSDFATNNTSTELLETVLEELS